MNIAREVVDGADTGNSLILRHRPLFGLPPPPTSLDRDATHTTSATPTSLTLIASCSLNGNTYPVGPVTPGGNTIPATQTQIVWNPYEYEQQAGAVPLAVATYVLKVWDDRGPTAAVSCEERSQ
jgi:hypothetical protein